jgi:hypothetical protein
MREQLGFLPGTEVTFEIDGDAIQVTKQSESDRGRVQIGRMRGRAGATLSTEEIMALTRA